MAKLIFATKTVQFYENLPHRKSYINPLTDDFNIEENIKKELKDKYPNDDIISKMPNNTNFRYLDDFLRKTTINVEQELKDYGYSMKFNFWNNINHAYLIHEDGFIEYLYIVERKCLNYIQQVWEFKFKLDIYRSYWPYVYKMLNNNKIKLLIDRAHINIFEKFKLNNDMDRIIYKFLTDKKYHWNDEGILSHFNNNIAIRSSYSLRPWDEFDISGNTLIPKAEDLKFMYGPISRKNDPVYRLWYGKEGFYYTIIKGTKTDDFSKSLLMWYGNPNIAGIYPLFDTSILLWNAVQPDEGIIFTKPEMRVYLEKLFPAANFNKLDKLPNSLTAQGNSMRGLKYPKISPRIISLNFAIKPIIPPLDASNPIYANRYRYVGSPRINTFANNKGNEYVPESIIPGYNDGDGRTNGHIISEIEYYIGNTYYTKNKGAEPQLGNINSRLNPLCDERIPNTDIVDLLILNIKNMKLNSDINYNYEPYLYSSNLFNIEYKHGFTNDKLKISPKLYFFNNIDYLYTFGILIRGYQYLQPESTYLIQWLDKGIYKEINKDGYNNRLITFFAPQCQWGYSQIENYLMNNRSSINAGLMNASITGAIGQIPLVGSFLTKQNPKIDEQPDKPVIPLTNFSKDISMYMGIQSISNTIASTLSTFAQLNDIRNQNIETRNLDSSLALTTSARAIYIINWIDDNIKQIICSYFMKQGYLLNRFESIIDLLKNKYLYCYMKCKEFKLFDTNEFNIKNEYLQYFEILLTTGVTFWHNTTILGDYSKQNWDTWLAKELSLNETV